MDGLALQDFNTHCAENEKTVKVWSVCISAIFDYQKSILYLVVPFFFLIGNASTCKEL